MISLQKVISMCLNLLVIMYEDCSTAARYLITCRLYTVIILLHYILYLYKFKCYYNSYSQILNLSTAVVIRVLYKHYKYVSL